MVLLVPINLVHKRLPLRSLAMCSVFKLNCVRLRVRLFSAGKVSIGGLRENRHRRIVHWGHSSFFLELRTFGDDLRTQHFG